MRKNQKLRARAANLLQRLRRSTVVGQGRVWHAGKVWPPITRHPIYTEADRCECASSRCQAAFKQDWKHGQSVILAN